MHTVWIRAYCMYSMHSLQPYRIIITDDLTFCIFEIYNLGIMLASWEHSLQSTYSIKLLQKSYVYATICNPYIEYQYVQYASVLYDIATILHTFQHFVLKVSLHICIFYEPIQYPYKWVLQFYLFMLS